jgi:hypothetical protein
MSEQQGSKEAWDYLVKASKTMTSNPHDLAHLLGANIWQKEGSLGMSICDESFAFGCYHGFAEEALKDNLDKLPALAKSCESVGTIRSGPWASCIHGLGHGVASYFRTTDLNGSLKACDVLSVGNNYCHDGVFMEFTTNAPAAFYKSHLSLDPLYPCTDLLPQYQSTCGRNQPYVMTKYLGNTIPQNAVICDKSENTDIKKSCFNTLGLMTTQSSGGDVEKIETVCRQIKNQEAQAQCITSAAIELIFQQLPNWQTNAPKLCQGLKGSDQQTCTQSISHIIQDYNRK